MIHIVVGTMVVYGAVPIYEVNWNVVIPTAVGVVVSLGIIVTFWDRIKKCFASKIEFDSLQKEVHELRLEVATLRKIDGKLDKILEAANNRKVRHD